MWVFWPSRFHNNLPLLVARIKYSLALAVDVLIITLSSYKVICAFPPVKNLHLLNKIEQEKKQVILVAPN